MMMRGILLMLLSFVLLAKVQASEWDHCLLQASNYGNGSGVSLFDKNCYEQTKQRAEKRTTYLGEDYSVYAADNIITVERKNDSKVNTLLTGETTRLSQIKSITVNEDNNELYVLIGDGIIYSYSLDLLGNVAPMRVIKTEEVFGAVEILYYDNKIFVLNPEAQNVIAFSKMANSEAQRKYQKLDLKLRKDSLGSGLVSIDRDDNNLGNIFVTYQNNKTSVIFSQ